MGVSLVDEFAQIRDEVAEGMEFVWEVSSYREAGARRPGTPRVFLGFRPLSYGSVRRLASAASKAKDGQRATVELAESTRLIVEACTGVWCETGDGSRTPLTGGDVENAVGPDLAAALGLDPGCGARATLTHLFIKEPEITQCAVALQEWSLAANGEADLEAMGE